jgi:homoserine kinase
MIKGENMNRVVKIRVPASTANLGPGFDTIGMALNLYNYIEINIDTNEFKIEISGEGANTIPKDNSNIVYKVVNAVFEIAKFKTNGLHIKLKNNIPIARGLGSSAAAIVGGALAANALVKNPLSLEELLLLVTHLG